MTLATKVDGRTARKFDAMRRVQEVALDMLEDRALSEVTIEDIARRAKVGAASVYRNFGTKEGLILWDEHDSPLVASIGDELDERPDEPLEAVRRALRRELETAYKRDEESMRRRVKLIMREPSLLAASALQQAGLRQAIERLFRRGRSALEADVLASVAVGLIDAAIRGWATGRPKGRLSAIVDATWAVGVEKARIFSRVVRRR